MSSDPDHLESRLQETEIRLAFLERELDEYKEAVNQLHGLTARLEKELTELLAGIQAAGEPDGGREGNPSAS
jgi:uncharacterized coiled-coil protein SlyX